MAKTLSNKTNFRVVVYPRSLGDLGYMRTSAEFLYGHDAEAQKRIERDMEERCNEIVADIKRHADNVGSAYVEFDQEPICEHCGAIWTEKAAPTTEGAARRTKRTRLQKPEPAMCMTNEAAAIKLAERDNLVGELAGALEDAVAALELYRAYGWPDRKGVLDKSRAALSKAREGAQS